MSSPEQSLSGNYISCELVCPGAFPKNIFRQLGRCHSAKSMESKKVKERIRQLMSLSFLLPPLQEQQEPEARKEGKRSKVD